MYSRGQALGDDAPAGSLDCLRKGGYRMQFIKHVDVRRLLSWAAARYGRRPLSGKDPHVQPPPVSDIALKAARSIRGLGHPPAIMIHGMTARTGTNYVYFLLQLHPDVVACKPAHEFFLLQHASDVQCLQARFDRTHPTVKSCMQAEGDMLPLLGSSVVNYLYSFVPEGKRLLLKSPNVLFLNYFRAMFPEEQLLVLLRDGRDVVSSYRNSFPNTRFADVCKIWDASAKVVQAFDRLHANTFPYRQVRYEDATRSPEQFVRSVCEALGLNADRYPYEKIDQVPVLGSSEVRVEGKWKWQEVKKPTGFDPIGRWKSWTVEEKAAFKAAAGESLRALGYAPTSDW